MRHTATAYYWGTEDNADILTDIHDHEQNGWHVHQIAPRLISKTVGNVTITESAMFVVYAKDDS